MLNKEEETIFRFVKKSQKILREFRRERLKKVQIPEKQVRPKIDAYFVRTLFLPESSDELFRGYRADFFLLCGNRVEEVSQAGQQSLLRPFVLRFVLQHFLPKWLAEVEGLEHGIGIAGVAKL